MPKLAFGLPDWLAPTLEVLSDVAGATSGGLLLWSGHRMLVARRLLKSQMDRNRSKIAALKKQLEDAERNAAIDPEAIALRVQALEKSQVELADADASASRYDPADLSLLRRGLALLVLSFLLKLAYHLVTKGPGSGS
jgi:hypothetical protein